MKKLKNIVHVKFSYVGTETDFNLFLRAIVRDYLTADNPATNPQTDFVEKVEFKSA